MKIDITKWAPDDSNFWESEGKKVAWRNLMISIPNLLLAFSVWIMWSVIVTQLREYGFHFGLIEDGMSEAAREEAWSQIRLYYWSLPAIAGSAGATLRIPHSFLISLAGGRNAIFTTTALLILPPLGAGLAMQDAGTPYMFFAFCALLSGIGGGAFASSMSNISHFFPKEQQGLALGLNAGIGNLGVSIAQALIPLVTGVFLFSAVSPDGNVVTDEGIAGIQNGAWFWVPLLVIAGIAAFFGMNNLKSATPDLPGTFKSLGNILYLTAIGLIAAGVGAWILVGLDWNMWIALPITIVLTILLMRYGSPTGIRKDINRQFAILRYKHNWIMTILYIMTFGSFIGYSQAFPLLTQELFVYTDPQDPNYVNPNAPRIELWAFIGPMIGALIRPVGGWLSDLLRSGARVTQWVTITQIVCVLVLAYFAIEIRNTDTPEIFWWPYFGVFMLLFLATGVGNASTFKTIPVIFSKEHAGAVLGWTSAIAAYGSFIIPRVFGEQIEKGNAEYALYGFAIFYGICLILNWWYYLGPRREYDKP